MDKETDINGNKSNDEIIKIREDTHSYKGLLNSDSVWKRMIGAFFYVFVGWSLIIGFDFFLLVTYEIILSILYSL